MTQEKGIERNYTEGGQRIFHAFEFLNFIEDFRINPTLSAKEFFGDFLETMFGERENSGDTYSQQIDAALDTWGVLTIQELTKYNKEEFDKNFYPEVFQKLSKIDSNFRKQFRKKKELLEGKPEDNHVLTNLRSELNKLETRVNSLENRLDTEEEESDEGDDLEPGREEVIQIITDSNLTEEQREDLRKFAEMWDKVVCELREIDKILKGNG